MPEPLIRLCPRETGASGPLRVAVLASGSGTNLQTLLDHAASGAPFSVVAVLCNRPSAGAIARAKAADVAHRVISHRDFRDRPSFERALCAALAPFDVELVVLAGFMRVLTATFLDVFHDRVVNVHPALCPAFPGLHAARQALDAGVKLTGCTVHLVDSGVDTGPIIAQAAVEVRDDDDEDTLQRRIQAEEHRLLPAVVADLARGALALDARRRVRREEPR